MRTHIATQIALAIAFLIMGVVYLAGPLGLVPDRRAEIERGRANLSEMFALQCASAATREDLAAMQDLATAIAQRNGDILWLGVRDAHGRLVAQAGPHGSPGATANADQNLVRVEVPIFLKGAKWGEVQFCFHPAWESGLVHGLFSPLTQLALFLSLTSLLVLMFLLRPMFRQLSPAVAAAHVRELALRLQVAAGTGRDVGQLREGLNEILAVSQAAQKQIPSRSRKSPEHSPPGSSL